MHVSVWRVGIPLVQSCFSIGEMNYLHASAPPTCPKGGMAVDASALSPFSAGKEGSGRQPQGGDAEQTAQAPDPSVGGWWALGAARACAQSSHVVLSNHQVIPERR